MDYQRALDAAQNGNHKLAQKILLEIINDNRGDYNTWYLLSQVTERKSLQVAALNKALLLKPKNEEAKREFNSLSPNSKENANQSKIFRNRKQDFRLNSYLHETPLDNLNLSTRTYNALRRSGIDSIEELSSLSTEHLYNIRFIGEQCVKEIVSKLDSYGHTYNDKVDSIPKKSSKHKKKNLNNLYIYNHQVLYPSLINDNSPLDILQLSPRTYNILKRARIETIGQLVNMPNEHLLDINHIGKRSITEIEKKLKTYDQVIISTPSLADQIGLINDSRIDDYPIDRILINRLGLPENIESSLNSKGVRSLSDLLFMPPGLVFGLNENEKDFVIRNLTMYFNWLRKQSDDVFAQEISSEYLPPLFKYILEKNSIDKLVSRGFSILSNRHNQVLTWRYGINGSIKTLEEVGEELNITRERVRQIQSKALQYLKDPTGRLKTYPNFVSFIDYFYYLIRENHGVMNEEDVYQELLEDRITDYGNASLPGIFMLTCELDRRFTYSKRQKYLALNSYPIGKIYSIFCELVEILNEKRAPCLTQDLLTEFKSTQYYVQHKDFISDEFIIACIKASPEIEKTTSGLVGLEKWSNTRTDELILALREIGKPAHFSEIASKTNSLLPPNQQTTQRIIHAHLGRMPDLFVRVGNGIFGLAEWGLHDDGNLANAAYRVIKTSGQVLHINNIIENVLKNWHVNPESIHMAIECDARFNKIGRGGLYGLTEWTQEESTTINNKTSEFSSDIEWFEEWLDNNVS